MRTAPFRCYIPLRAHLLPLLDAPGPRLLDALPLWARDAGYRRGPLDRMVAENLDSLPTTIAVTLPLTK